MKPLWEIGIALLLACSFPLAACSDDDSGGGQDASVQDGSEADSTVPEDGAVEDGGASDGTVDGGGTAMTPEEWVNAQHQVMCEYAVRCHSLEEQGMPFTVDQCKTFIDWVLMSSALRDALASGIDRGTLSIDRDAVEACVAAWSQLDCYDVGDQQSLLPDDCDNMFVGTQQEGGACNSSYECTTGWCDTRSVCPGTCEAPVAAGHVCDGDSGPCGPGLLCLDDGQGGTTCQTFPPAGEGQACDPTDNRTCRAGLYCGASDKLCHAQVGAGQACDGNFACGPGLVCDRSGHCAQVQVLTQEGDACNRLDGRVCDVSSGLKCLVDNNQTQEGHCIVAPLEGEDCIDGNNTFLGCSVIEATYCDMDTNKCEPLIADGNDCATQGAFACQSFYCDSGSGQCQEAPPCR